VFENRVLRRIFGSQREEVTGDWRRLHIEELHNLYSSAVIKSREVRWAVNVACMGGLRRGYKILVGKTEGKRSRGRPSRRWEDSVRMDFKEIAWQGVDWSHVGEDTDHDQALVNTVVKLGFHKRRGIFLTVKVKLSLCFF
jgi:hypothetical protein